MSKKSKTSARAPAEPSNFPSQEFNNDSLCSFQIENNPNQIHSYLSPTYGLTSEDGQYISVFKSIKSFITELSIEKNKKSDIHNEEFLDKQLEDAKTIVSLNHQITYFKDIISSHEKKLVQNEESYDKTVKQNQNRHRKQIKKYIELVNEKEHEAQSLKKTIKSQNSQIQNLTIEIQSLTQAKTNLENTILKSVDSMRTNLKQFNYNFEENDLDKVVLEGKYKQLCEKVEHVVRQSEDAEMNKAKVEKKYEKLKEVYEILRNESIELKFEIERLKIKLKDQSNTEKGKLKSLLISNDLQTSRTNGFQQLKQSSRQIINQLNMIQQQRGQIKQFLLTNCKFDELIDENIDLKDKIEGLHFENDQLKLKVQGPSYQDQILQTRNPSLYNILLQKKNNIENLETRIEEIEKIAKKAEQLLKIKIQQGLNEGNRSLQNQDKKTKSKLKAEKMIQEFEVMKDKIIAQERETCEKLRDSDKQLIKQLENLLHQIQDQNQRLKNLTQNLTAQIKRLRSILSEPQENGKKKKTAGKTKGRTKCDVCSKELGPKFSKCEECFMKYHTDCIKYHQCSYKNIEDIVSNDLSY